MWAALALVGCGAPCVDAPVPCDPLYEPTFDALHARTLVPSCALDGGCHTSDRPAAGLDLEDADAAWDGLTARIDADDLGCTTLISRVDSPDPAFVMPPGAPLDEAERCVLRLWVQAGAPR